MASQHDIANRNFYAWEVRGRGILTYPYTVAIEPPFVQFFDAEYTAGNNGYLPSTFEKIGAWASLLVSKKKEVVPSISNIEYYNSALPKPDDRLCEYVAFHLQPDAKQITIGLWEYALTMLSDTACPVIFEIIATSDHIQFQILVERIDAHLVRSQLTALFGDMVAVGDDIAQAAVYDKAGYWSIREYGLQNEFMLPLGYTTPKFDTATALYGLLHDLDVGSSVVVQIIFQGLRKPWANEIMDSVTTPSGKLFFENAPFVTTLAEQKLAYPLYGACVRAVYATESPHKGHGMMQTLSKAISTISGTEHNRLVELSARDIEPELYDSLIMNRQSIRTGIILNTQELLSLVHLPFPNPNLWKLYQTPRRVKCAPKVLCSSDNIIGYTTDGNETVPVSIPVQARLKHTHILGTTGSGKSVFMQALIKADLGRGIPFCMLDPHGDIAHDVLQLILPEQVENTIFFDVSDTAFPIGLNILSAKTETEKIVLSSDLVALFKRQSTSWGDQMTAILQNAINVFLDDGINTGTLLDLRLLLTNDSYRYKLLFKVQDPLVKQFWQVEFKSVRKDAVMPIILRLDALLRPKILRKIFAQNSGLDFNEILHTGKNVIVRIPAGLVGEENAHLLAGIIVSKIHQAALGRANIPEQDRNPYYLYIDEFHHFATPSMATILSGARKFGLGLTLSHQDIDQVSRIDSTLANSLLTNPCTRVCFKLGIQDAKRIEPSLSYFDATDVQNLSVGQAIVRYETNDQDFSLAVVKPEKNENTGVETAIIQQSQQKYATPKEDIEKEIAARYMSNTVKEEEPEPVEKPIVQPVIEKKIEQVVEPVIKEQTAQDVAEYIEAKEKLREHTLHSYLQKRIKKMAEDRGFRAVPEDKVTDGFVDVGLYREELKYAVEISVTNTPEYETKNIQKCLNNGFQKVFMCSEDITHLGRIHQYAMEHLLNEQKEQVQFVSVDQLFEILDADTQGKKVSENIIKGYRVKIRFKED